ncbi:MAG: UvrD-helicase domain-containing protein [Candidatus Aminicenantes bacterium]|nr:UvrD-helicase domain-containing protein [Candidatus Aminicenantes bacterium]NIM77848.1 UvrD-helicase domain-containing protein [Candidatus Aminicenantes bacterium]NIN17160.1 UvrD-helicase domain-containing protein [Candidatus Aminicenantes bacterium]NIN41053.1 UvrD-helicase domain-containing protein [Candidatus Aminicenantes bacterium]NIN83858.1 UvrD-helicase domain-containing protein [Candidatus Aminicenantes bacterium]
MIVVLINDTVKKYLLKQPGDTREKIRDKFEYLETGIWDGGLKVKKLKGTSSKYVFEARLDRGNRILFTLGYPPPALAHTGNEKDTNMLIVYVWGIVVHDDISRKSRTIIPANVPFLRFHDYEEVFLEDVDMEELEPSYFTQENISQRTADESGCQRWYPIDEPEWQRIRMYTRDDFELFLHLTPEQDEILSTPLPVMISGTAGSGKTSLAIYYLLNRNLNKKKKLFITYNKYLRDFAGKLYHGLLNQREWKDDVILPDFYTFKELCLETAGKQRFDPAKEVDFNRFKDLFTSYPNHQSFDAALVWEEIRAIIKGAVPRVNLPVLEHALRRFKKGTVNPGLVKQLQEQFILFSKLESFHKVDKFVHKYLKIDIVSFAANIKKHLQPDAASDREKECVCAVLEKTAAALKKDDTLTERKYLSFAEYEMLGKKKAPNFQGNRKDIYRIFQWYQDKLETGGLWDELDMMPGAVEEKYTYDILVCDEVQDFTDTQLDLLFNFARNPNNMFLAGDTRQTINPSGFRWEEVRKHFYERGLEVPELKYLSLNFRSSGSIVELSNILLELKEKFTGRKSDEPREAWKYKGRPVTVVTGIDSEEMLGILNAAGAERTILTRTETEKETLKKHLGTELVFTIKEAKGLEFDTVVLWKFCDDLASESEDVWKATLDLTGRNIHKARIRHEISLLYVGVTRCQKDLIVYDGKKPSVIWESEPLKDNVYITDDRRYLANVWNVVSTPGEWVEQGHYFFEREYFRAAAECFRNGDDPVNLSKALAHHYERAGNYREAAVNFEKIGEREKAAVNYENAGEYKQARVIWERLDNRERIIQCRAALLEEEKNFREAGRLYLEIKNYTAAVECFRQAKSYRTAAEIYLEHLHNPKEAAQYYEYSRDYDKAAELYSRLEHYDKAAELYFMNKNYPEAEVLWIKTGNWKNLLELYRRTGRHEEVLKIYQEQGNLEKAARYLKNLDIDRSRLIEEGDVFFRDRGYFQALVRFLVAEEPAKIADCYYHMGQYEESIPYYEQARDFYTAAGVYEKIRDYENAFEVYFGTDRDKENNFAMSAAVYEKLTDPAPMRGTAMGYYFEEDYERAFFLFTRLGGFETLEGICYALQGDKQKAFRKWETCRNLGEFLIIAEGCLEKDLIDTGAQFFLALPDRPGSFEPGTFSTDLDITAVADLMRAHFKEHVSTKRIEQGEDEPPTESQKKELGIWGHFIRREDIDFKNVMLVLHYLEKIDDYTTLVKYFKKFQRFSPKRFKKTLKDIEKNGLPRGKKVVDKASAFRRILEGETKDLNERLAKIEIGKDNYGLFLAGGVEEQHRKKAIDWCKANGLKEEVEEYLRFLAADEP